MHTQYSVLELIFFLLKIALFKELCCIESYCFR